ncbi:MAG: MFS transporter [Clostridia bacterium]|nr:MFS transporter [Clostridia bacterium]
MNTKNKTIPVFIVAAFAVFLATFNETFMNVALADMCASLGVGFSTIQWLVTAYMLGAAIMVPVSAFMFRKVPTKILFLCTVGCFIVGSLLGALAGNNFILVLVARIIQAIGSGMLIPVAMNIVLIIAPKEKLGSYMGIMGAMTTLGPSLSVIIAGLLLTISDFHILFWVFGALCLICFILGAIFVGNVAKLSKPKLDVLSVILISIALIGILFAISFVFSMWYIALIALALGVLALVWFVLRQRKLPDPLINIEPLKVKAFSISVILNMLALIMVFAFNVILPQYLQSVTGVDALTASLTLFPAIFLCCVISPIAGKIYDKHGAKWLLIIGFALMAIFAVLLALFISSPSLVLLGALYVPVIVGSAFIIGPVQSYGLSSLKPEQNPHGVTIFSTGFQIAGCIGASLFASAYAAIIGNSANFAQASNTSFLIIGLIIAGVAVLGLVLSLILNHLKRKENNQPKAQLEENTDADAKENNTEEKIEENNVNEENNEETTVIEGK